MILACRVSSLLFLVLSSFHFLHGVCYADTIDLAHIRDLITSGRASQAFAILEPYEFEHAGEPQFDYLLGLAALESGDPARATIIFERVLAVDPNLLGARLDMARAHFALGDRSIAKKEFETLLLQDPPLAARATIMKYLAALETQEEMITKSTSIAAYIEAGAGYDTNINNSTSQSTLFVPAFPNVVFSLDSKNVKKSDSYASWAAGVSIDHKIRSDASLYAAANVRDKIPRVEHDFGILSADGQLGIALDHDGEILRFGVLGGALSLGNILNWETYGTNGEWRHPIDSHNQINIFSQFAAYRFPGQLLRANNYDQFLAGSGWLHVTASETTAIFGSVYGGGEHAIRDRADGNDQLVGIRVGYQGALTPVLDLVATSGVQYRRYDKENVAFLVNRVDKLFDLTVAVQWHINNGWILRPQIIVIRNHSNLPINEFDGVDVSLNLHRDFK
jgi:tetratricopeptide (TPR) repeat protein